MTRSTWPRPFLGGAPARLVGEHDQADLVVVADRGEGEHGGQFRRQLVLDLLAEPNARRRSRPPAASRSARAPREPLHERMAQPRGDVPVDGANLVAGQVFAHLLELHAVALEHAMVLARERSVTSRFVRIAICRIFLRISRGIMRFQKMEWRMAGKLSLTS